MNCLRTTLGLLFGALLVQSPQLAAQSAVAGSLRGMVADSSGAPLPGATVAVTSEALVAGSQRTTTNEQGGYRFASLPPGIYRIETTLQGFRTAQQDGVRIRLGEALTLNLKLELPTVTTETVVIA